VTTAARWNDRIRSDFISAIPVERFDEDDKQIAHEMPPCDRELANSRLAEKVGKTGDGCEQCHHDTGAQHPFRGKEPKGVVRLPKR
jgi:hypothetical protein